MSENVSTTVGFVSAGASSMPHYNSFLPLIPTRITMDFVGLELYSGSLYEIEGKKETIVRRVRELTIERGWNAVIVTAAPTEVLNPGLFEALQAALSVPFTTALHACAAALRVYGAKRVLLLTPFDGSLNDLICAHLELVGVTAMAPHSFSELGIAQRMSPDDVFEFTKKAARRTAADGIDAIYFQGAVLDPIKVLEKIEREIRLLAVASNPAMLWYTLSQLGLSYPISGYGRLMREWPELREGKTQ